MNFITMVFSECVEIRRTSQLGYKTGNGKKRQGDDSDAEGKASSSENPEDQKSRLQI